MARLRFGSTRASSERARSPAKRLAAPNGSYASNVADSPYRPAPTQLTDSGDPIFEALWARVEDEWDILDAHHRVLDHALASAKLPELAGRYGAYKESVTRGEFANKRIVAISLAAMNMLEATRMPRYERPPWYIIASAGLIFVCAMVFVWATLSR